MPRSRQTQSINVEKHVRQYEASRRLYVDFTEKLKLLLEDLLVSSIIKYQVVESRTKEVESFREKITRATKRYSDPLREITDLIGLRVIVYYLEDIELVSKLIEKEFRVDTDASIDKGRLLQPNEFGYRSVHYIVSLSSSRSNLLEWNPYNNLKAEIQVRTVLQHAWAAISHALQYKREQDVPSIFKRRLSRLAGLFELSDEEFSGLRRDQQALASAVSAKLGKGHTALELNAITLGEYFKESSLISSIVEAAVNAGFYNSEEDQHDFSQLIDTSNDVGIATIEQVDKILKASKPWAQKYFNRVHEQNDVTWTGSAAFFVLLIIIAANIDKINKDYLVNKGWSSSIADYVIKAANQT